MRVLVNELGDVARELLPGGHGGADEVQELPRTQGGEPAPKSSGG